MSFVEMLQPHALGKFKSHQVMWKCCGGDRRAPLKQKNGGWFPSRRLALCGNQIPLLEMYFTRSTTRWL
jgi:hypothetical protein